MENQSSPQNVSNCLFYMQLREVDPEIQSVAAPSPVDQSGIKKHDNNQSLCNVNHLHSNVDKPRSPTVSTELQP